jgi:hypothetical protein
MTKPAANASGAGCLGFFPGLRTVIFCALFLAVVWHGPEMMNMDGDVGRHLTVGALILDSGRVPTADVFSITRLGAPFTAHEWLSEVVYTLAYRLLGLNGVVLLAALLIASAFSLVLDEMLRRNVLLLVAVCFTLLAAAVSGLHWLTRPHLFTWVIIGLWARELDQIARGNGRHWWRLPAIMLVWANLHGAFVYGFVILGLVGAGIAWESLRTGQGLRAPGVWKPFGLAVGASAAVSLVNPAGLSLWTTSLGFVQDRYMMSHNLEFMPADFQSASILPFLLMFGIALLLLSLGPARLQAHQALLLAGWTGLSLLSARNIPIYAILAAPILAELASDWLRSLAPLARFTAYNLRLLKMEMVRRYIPWELLWAALLGLLLARGVALDAQQVGNRFDPARFPVAAVDWLQANPPRGNMFNYFTWGGYLLYRQWPAQNVFIDGTMELYGEPVLRAYDQVISAGDGWQAVLAKYDVTWLIVPPDSPPARALALDPAWRQAYRDQTAVILIHD